VEAGRARMAEGWGNIFLDPQVLVQFYSSTISQQCLPFLAMATGIPTMTARANTRHQTLWGEAPSDLETRVKRFTLGSHAKIINQSYSTSLK